MSNSNFKRYWNIRASSKESAEILIYEQIGAGFFEDGIGAKEFAKELKALGDIKTLTVRINSPGGSVFEGQAIYSQLKAHKAEKIVHIDGIAASIASVIAMAGDLIIMPKNATMMVHDPTGMTIGNADDMRKMAEALDTIKLGIIAAYRDKTGLSDEKISELMTDETWMSAADAVKNGFADEIDEPVKIAASFDLSIFKNFKNVPATLLPGNKGDVKVEDKSYKKDLFAERERVCALRAIAKEFRCETLADQAISEGWSEDQLRVSILAEMKVKKTESIVALSTSAITGGHVEMQKKLIPARSPKYWDLFRGGQHTFQDSNESWGEFLKRVTLNIRNAMTETIPSEGGFSVPVQYAATLMDDSLETELVRPRAWVWPMTTASLKIPAWDGATHSSNLYGGFSGTWLAENATATDQKGKLRQMTLTAKKLGIYTSATSELVSDGLNFEVSLTDAIRKALSWYLDLAFLTGDGATKPLGILNSDSLITVSKESGQLGSTIVYENLSKMYARLHPNCHRKAVWLCNSTAIPQLLQLSLGLGTAGIHFPVLRETDGRFFIFGREVLFTEKLPALGTKGDIILADLSQYMIGLRQDVYLERNNAPGWHEDVLSYRILLRCDGQPSWDQAITPKNGDSLSWAVTLQAR